MGTLSQTAWFPDYLLEREARSRGLGWGPRWGPGAAPVGAQLCTKTAIVMGTGQQSLGPSSPLSVWDPGRTMFCHCRGLSHHVKPHWCFLGLNLPL